MAGDAGTVDQNIDGTAGRDGSLHQRVALRGVCEVGDTVADPAAASGDAIGSFTQRRLATAGDQHARAGGSQVARDCRADAGAAAGDDNAAVHKLHYAAPFDGRWLSSHASGWSRKLWRSRAIAPTVCSNAAMSSA